MIPERLFQQPRLASPAWADDHNAFAGSAVVGSVRPGRIAPDDGVGSEPPSHGPGKPCGFGAKWQDSPPAVCEALWSGLLGYRALHVDVAKGSGGTL
jgi:hypothetical protein